MRYAVEPSCIRITWSRPPVAYSLTKIIWLPPIRQLSVLESFWFRTKRLHSMCQPSFHIHYIIHFRMKITSPCWEWVKPAWTNLFGYFLRVSCIHHFPIFRPQPISHCVINHCLLLQPLTWPNWLQPMALNAAFLDGIQFLVNASSLFFFHIIISITLGSLHTHAQTHEKWNAYLIKTFNQWSIL